MRTKLLLSTKLPKLLTIGILIVFTTNVWGQNNDWHSNNGQDTVHTNKHVRTTKSLTVTGDLNVKGLIIVDTMKISRIMPPTGDSVIHFGTHSINYLTTQNIISWSQVSPTQRGLTIANGFSFAKVTLPKYFGISLAFSCKVLIGSNPSPLSYVTLPRTRPI